MDGWMDGFASVGTLVGGRRRSGVGLGGSFGGGGCFVEEFLAED